MHWRNFINIDCFLLPHFNILLFDKTMHFNCQHLFQFPQAGKLIWPLQKRLLAGNGSWTAGNNRAVLESGLRSFWVRNPTEIQIIHNKELWAFTSTQWLVSLLLHKWGWNSRIAGAHSQPSHSIFMFCIPAFHTLLFEHQLLLLPRLIDI